jgi:DNA-binding Lrp family transcriptional regulator
MYTSFIGIYVRPGQAGHLEKALGSMVEVLEMYEMSGPFELLVKVDAGSRRGIEVLAGNILHMDGVEKTFNMLYMDEKCADNAPAAPIAAFIGLSIEAGKEHDVKRELLSGGNVCETYVMLYPYGLFIKVGYAQERELAAILDRAVHIEGVRACDEYLVTRKIK